jgi:hypothetical protein
LIYTHRILSSVKGKLLNKRALWIIHIHILLAIKNSSKKFHQAKHLL